MSPAHGLTIAQTFRHQLIAAPGSPAQKMRARRHEWLREAFPGFAAMSVIDLGGTAEWWLRAAVHPASVHVVNIAREAGDLPPWLRASQADACHLPAAIRAGRYDLAFSNSVLEHVGGWDRRQRFSEAVHALAPAHWVQTPYRYFPLEPHWLFPGFQFLPVAVRAELACRWPLSHAPAASREQGLREALETELVGRSEMRLLFPGSKIRLERVAGLVKSLIAVRGRAA
jgi:hypothetical protein